MPDSKRCCWGQIPKSNPVPWTWVWQRQITDLNIFLKCPMSDLVFFIFGLFEQHYYLYNTEREKLSIYLASGDNNLLNMILLI